MVSRSLKELYTSGTTHRKTNVCIYIYSLFSGNTTRELDPKYRVYVSNQTKIRKYLTYLKRTDLQSNVCILEKCKCRMA